ncbi:MAG: ABC-three component system protein [Candidatus Woesearchaeota archaeon]
MNSPFTAKPTIKGFIYQFKVALLLLLQSEVDSKVSVESNDDIELNDSVNGGLVQVKHHKKDSVLRDSDLDFWKSLRNWALFSKAKNSSTSYYLITTQKTIDKSICNLLTSRNSERNTELIFNKIEEFLNETQNKEIIKLTTYYLKLSELEKKDLINKIRIIDGGEDIQEIDELLKKEIRRSTREQFLDAVYTRFISWWYRIIESHIVSNTNEPIYLRDVETKLNDISDQFKLDSLPIDFLDLELDKDMSIKAEQRLFVKQLEYIQTNIQTIQRAILDYYKAYAQRSQWIRDNLLIEEELIYYEKKLIDGWEELLCKIKDLHNLDTLDELALKKLGRELYHEVIEQEIFIRKDVREPYVMRGSYHILADQNSPSIWWHPYFKEQVEKLLLEADVSK